MTHANIAMISQIFLSGMVKISIIKSLPFNYMFTWYLWTEPEPPG